MRYILIIYEEEFPRWHQIYVSRSPIYKYEGYAECIYPQQRMILSIKPYHAYKKTDVHNCIPSNIKVRVFKEP